MQQSVEIFGHLPDGRAVERVTLRAGALSVKLLCWGAILQDLRFGELDYSLTQGSASLGPYLDTMRYHGPIIGPVVNRITGAKAQIGDQTHMFEANQTPNICLHSGETGSYQQLWHLQDVQPDRATLTLEMPDGQGGFPGNRQITATFALLPEARLRLTISAKSDAPTLFNFANHSYWNLDGTDSYAGHILEIAADNFLPTTAHMTPTGDIVPTNGTNYDFRTPRPVSAHAPEFDTNFCLSQTAQVLRPVLELTGQSGVKMRMSTTETGMQVYDARDTGKPYSALAFEAQSWPDAPNHSSTFPSILYRADVAYHQITEWQFYAPLL